MVFESWRRSRKALSTPLDARDAGVTRDARYRVGRWLGWKTPPDLFGVLLLGSFGFPLASWIEWLRGGLSEPLGIEVAMVLAWMLCALLAYAWWFFARQERVELGIVTEEPAAFEATRSLG